MERIEPSESTPLIDAAEPIAALRELNRLTLQEVVSTYQHPAGSEEERAERLTRLLSAMDRQIAAVSALYDAVGIQRELLQGQKLMLQKEKPATIQRSFDVAAERCRDIAHQLETHFESGSTAVREAARHGAGRWRALASAVTDAPLRLWQWMARTGQKVEDAVVRSVETIDHAFSQASSAAQHYAHEGKIIGKAALATSVDIAHDVGTTLSPLKKRALDWVAKTGNRFAEHRDELREGATPGAGAPRP